MEKPINAKKEALQERLALIKAALAKVGYMPSEAFASARAYAYAA